MKKYLTYIIIAFTLSCGEKPDYKQSFKNNVQLFDDMLSYLEENYLGNLRYNTQLRLIFYNCEKSEARLGSDMCDEVLSGYMAQLNIREIAVEKVGCERIAFYRFPYSKIYFMLNNESYYLYDYCEVIYAYESDNIHHVTIQGNWSYLKDSSYP